jgi:hypothetical protein
VQYAEEIGDFCQNTTVLNSRRSEGMELKMDHLLCMRPTQDMKFDKSIPYVSVFETYWEEMDSVLAHFARRNSTVIVALGDNAVMDSHVPVLKKARQVGGEGHTSLIYANIERHFGGGAAFARGCAYNTTPPVEEMEWPSRTSRTVWCGEVERRGTSGSSESARAQRHHAKSCSSVGAMGSLR